MTITTAAIVPRHAITIQAVDDTIDDDQLATIFGPDGEDAYRSNDGIIASVAVDRAIALVDGSGVIPQWREWEREYLGAILGNRANAGRPARFDYRIVLILMFTALLDNSPTNFSTLADILTARMTDLDRVKLGFPTPPTGDVQKALWSAWKNGVECLDPFLSKRNKKLTLEEHLQLASEEADDVNVPILIGRLDWIANTLLDASYRTLPKVYRDRWKGNIALDATKIGAHDRLGTRVDAGRIGIDRDAGRYHRDGNHDGEGRKHTETAFEATFAVTARNTDEDPAAPVAFPHIALGVAFHRPGKEISQQAANVAASIYYRGYPTGLFIADRAYAPHSLPELLQMRARAMGYRFVADYRSNNGGRREGAHGAILVEGKFYCPAMPEKLVNASTDYRAAEKTAGRDRGVLGELRAAWKRLINARKDYELTAKETPRDGSPTPMMCPAAGPRPTVKCPLKKRPADETRGLTPIQKSNLPIRPDRICTNKTSTHFAFEDGIRELQEFPYGTDEWEKVYGFRNSAEQYNAALKSPLHDGDSSIRRQARGHADQYLAVAIRATVTNLRLIRSFLLAQGGRKPTEVKLSAKDRKSMTRVELIPEVARYIPANTDTPLDVDHLARRRAIRQSKRRSDRVTAA